MKRFHHKFLKLCISEILLITGYQRTTSSSISILADVGYHVLESLCNSIRSKDPKVMLKHLHSAFGAGAIDFSKMFTSGECTLKDLKILPKNYEFEVRDSNAVLSSSDSSKVLEKSSEDVNRKDFSQYLYDLVDSYLLDTLSESLESQIDDFLNQSKESGTDEDNNRGDITVIQSINNDDINDRKKRKYSDFQAVNNSSQSNIYNLTNDPDNNPMKSEIMQNIPLCNNPVLRTCKNTELQIDHSPEQYQNDINNSTKHINSYQKSIVYSTDAHIKLLEELTFTEKNLHNELIVEINDSGGWMNDDDYILLLENNAHRIHNLSGYQPLHGSEIIEEIKDFCFNDPDKSFYKM
ncbi:hypothetical protein EDEG_02693 [Edhazardia aedis USNM 41457]|uniref:Uncharacterized protein n=1 Tax=Edhazardia aedis (strain USNM 41457) TaxID=1003232 RepID=J8ZTB7_EDHAE|nr:hypothetical protein EDEG_02693 [Edhazardia aedis USNM 41457]|eukprot:EJW02928.1 hypothetical protein EDEG_02693 [Edhazardia aedis USNM 41457]